ncbi:hypothetical protein LY78DRAFT_594149, partial [Colletotrichum sublineola]
TSRLTTNTKLLDKQERVICLYINCLDRMSLRVRKELVRDAANRLLKEAYDPSSTIPAPTVGINWVARFVKRQGYICIKDKVLELSRKAAENAESFQAYFN